jgi:hypothetical protein
VSWPGTLLKGAAGAAVAAGWAPPAQATPEWTTDAGVYLAYHFGGGAPGHFALGLEARRYYGELPGCGYSERQIGALGRIEVVGWDQVRLAVGPQLIRTNFYTEVAADLSLGVRLGRDPGLHAEPGLEGALVSLMRARMAYAITRQFSAGGGLRVPRNFRGCVVEGRPLRREGGRALLPAAVLVDGPRGADDNSGLFGARTRTRTRTPRPDLDSEYEYEYEHQMGRRPDRASRASGPAEPGPAHADLAHLGCLPPEQRQRIALEVQETAGKRLETLMQR